MFSIIFLNHMLQNYLYIQKQSSFLRSETFLPPIWLWVDLLHEKEWCPLFMRSGPAYLFSVDSCLFACRSMELSGLLAPTHIDECRYNDTGTQIINSYMMYSGTPFERPPWRPSGKATYQCKSKHKCIDFYPWREDTFLMQKGWPHKRDSTV